MPYSHKCQRATRNLSRRNTPPQRHSPKHSEQHYHLLIKVSRLSVLSNFVQVSLKRQASFNWNLMETFNKISLSFMFVKRLIENLAKFRMFQSMFRGKFHLKLPNATLDKNSEGFDSWECSWLQGPQRSPGGLPHKRASNSTIDRKNRAATNATIWPNNY